MLFQSQRHVETICMFEDEAWVVLRLKDASDKDSKEIFSSCTMLFIYLLSTGRGMHGEEVLQ